jgi:hypothetical protein
MKIPSARDLRSKGCFASWRYSVLESVSIGFTRNPTLGQHGRNCILTRGMQLDQRQRLAAHQLLQGTAFR